MRIDYSQSFRKSFRKRIPPNTSLDKRYKERLALFIKNRSNPVLKNHKLSGALKGSRAFSITGDIRVVYVEESKEFVTFIDIGTHNQVYS